MGEHKRNPITPGGPGASTPLIIELAAPQEIERTAPRLATHTGVSGSVDCLRIEFFYVPPSRARAAIDGQHSPVDGIERRGNHVTLRAEPVARVALPATVAVEMILRIVETGVLGVNDLLQLAPDAGERFARIARGVAAVMNRVKASQATETAAEGAGSPGEDEHG